MYYLDPRTGKVFGKIEDARSAYCISENSKCAECPFPNCVKYSQRNPAMAARLMGYEVIGDTPTVIYNTPTETHDSVNHPAHYTQGGIECIDALKAATAGLEGIQAVCAANAIKYIWRFKDKNGTEDLDKAIWYINRLKEEIQNG